LQCTAIKAAGGRKGGGSSSCCCCVLCVLVLLPLAVCKIQVPLKRGTCFTYFVHRYVLVPVKSGMRSCFSKCRNPSSIIGFLRNPAGMYSLKVGCAEGRIHRCDPYLLLQSVRIAELCEVLLEKVSVCWNKFIRGGLNQVVYSLMKKCMLMHCYFIKSVVDVSILE
jgi:hypothetical protein